MALNLTVFANILDDQEEILYLKRIIIYDPHLGIAPNVNEKS
jgi:hypothetical protein